MKTGRRKVVILTEIISPYRIPVFNKIAEDERLDLKVIFFAEMTGERKWVIQREQLKFSYQVLPRIAFPLPDRFPLLLNPGVFLTLLRLNPDVIFCGGYHHPSFFLAAIYTKLFHRKFILWCESHEKSIRIRHPWAKFLRERMIHQSSAYIVPGTISAEFIHAFGVGGKKIYLAPNAVDNDFFESQAMKVRSRKEVLKKERSFPKHLILYTGRLLKSKGVGVLLDAFSKISSRPDIGLILVGDGRDEDVFKRYCKEHRLERIFFEGFKQQGELPFYYGIADLFVMPSLRDEWGLVLNEAMASGLPVLAADQVGATYDLVQDGENGYRFHLEDSGKLADLMLRLVDDEPLRSRMGKRSLEIIANYSPARCAEGFIHASLEASEKAWDEKSLTSLVSHGPPLVTVIMPSYNQGLYIKDAVESVLNQDCPHVELTVIDAGSTDDTFSILERFGDQITVIKAPGTKQSAVMNKGLQLSHGNILAFLNADDLYAEGTIQKIVDFLEENPDTDMVYGDCDIIDERGKRLMTYQEIGFDYISYLFLGQYISYPTAFFRRRIYSQVGLLDTGLEHAMDYDYWLRIAQLGKIQHISKTLARFRWHPASKTVIFSKNAKQEAEWVRHRYARKRFPLAWFEPIYDCLFWLIYKLQRVWVKFCRGRYFLNLPQPLVFFLWKQNLKRKHTLK